MFLDMPNEIIVDIFNLIFSRMEFRTWVQRRAVWRRWKVIIEEHILPRFNSMMRFIKMNQLDGLCRCAPSLEFFTLYNHNEYGYFDVCICSINFRSSNEQITHTNFGATFHFII